MKIKGLTVLTAAAVMLPCASALAARAHSAGVRPPRLKALTYTPLSTDGADGFLEAHWTATVQLYTAAPSIFFTIDSLETENIRTEAGPEKSYKAGIHKVSFNSDALPSGTMRVTLYTRQKVDGRVRHVKSSDPATLVIAEAPEGSAGSGMVSKI